MRFVTNELKTLLATQGSFIKLQCMKNKKFDKFQPHFMTRSELKRGTHSKSDKPERKHYNLKKK